MGAVLGTAGLVVVLIVAGVVGIAIAAGNAASQASAPPASLGPQCPAADPVTVGDVVVPRGPVAGYCQDRLVNAAQVIRAAESLGIGTRTQTIGVMTAIGESGLVNLDHGDAAGPDSRGLFQQRDNGAWGTYAERMDPYTAALHFFQKAITVPGWQTMAPTQLAHTVQRNADPDYYAQYWPDAEQVVAALTGQPD
ncbi:hypothetical protein [Gryllotalpicola protaetiae]|uniref:Peptidase M23 n=1 Tax=Gryllotalpicola protaetiae TaxID=2419771 RepID=A0A387BMI8_9MICO|nr:hypothetical protein [Gryllotalpicola protaetiae]AYG02236.1 hypothetical protein D7I44_00935 [Gryllotalpicola protaetiae]